MVNKSENIIVNKIFTDNYQKNNVLKNLFLYSPIIVFIVISILLLFSTIWYLKKIWCISKGNNKDYTPLNCVFRFIIKKFYGVNMKIVSNSFKQSDYLTSIMHNDVMLCFFTSAHVLAVVVSLTIILFRVIFIREEIHDTCLDDYTCYIQRNSTWQIDTCNNTNTEEDVYFCENFDIKSYSSFLADLGSYNGLLLLLYRIHRYIYDTIKMIKKIFRKIFCNFCFDLFHKKRSKRFITLFFIIISISFIVLIGILAEHHLKNLISQYEEYLLIKILIASSVCTASTIEEYFYVLQKLNYVNKSEKISLKETEKNNDNNENEDINDDSEINDNETNTCSCLN